MRTFTDSVLSVADSISGKLGPVTVLLEGIVERIVPQTTAQACGGVPCYDECVGPCGPYGTEYYTVYYSPTVQDCNNGYTPCYTRTCSC